MPYFEKPSSVSASTGPDYSRALGVISDWESGQLYSGMFLTLEGLISYPMTASRCYSAPCWVPRDVVVDGLAIRTGGAAVAGSTARLGLYNLNETGNHGDLFIDAGSVSTDVVLNTYCIGSITPTLIPAGMYWSATWFSAASNIYAGNYAASGLGGFMTGPMSSGTLVPQVRIVSSVNYSEGLPVSPPAFQNMSGTAGTNPHLFFRVA